MVKVMYCGVECDFENNVLSHNGYEQLIFCRRCRHYMGANLKTPNSIFLTCKDCRQYISTYQKERNKKPKYQFIDDE